jgi:hypothetical protein
MLGIISHGPQFQEPTPEARYDAFKEAADELSRRGLDGLALARYGMRREVAAPLLSALIVRLVFSDSIDPLDRNSGVDADRWCAVLDLAPPAPLEPIEPIAPNRYEREVSVQWFQEVFTPVTPQIYQWIANASLDELVNLTPPGPEAQAWLHAIEPPDSSLREKYRWAVDHFAKTYFREWSTTSLHFELRWLDGDILPPCPNELMLDRKVSREEITQEIARRAVYNEKPDPGESLVEEMSRHAGKLLRQGRFREAAAVFEFGVHQRPEDPELRNNLGFCLIPIEPREALDHLRAAANMGYSSTDTNTHDQMCCYVAIGRSRAALNVADLEAQKPGHVGKQALLWRQASNRSWEIFETDHPFRSIARFAAEIARTEGWKDQEEHWTATSNQEAETPTSPKRQETNESPLSDA